MGNITTKIKWSKFFIALFLMINIVTFTKVIRVVGDENFPPYEFVNEKGQPDGFLVDIMRALSNELGIPFDITLMKWTDAQKALLEGKADVIEGMKVTDERKILYDFGEEYFKIYTVGVVRIDSSIKSLQEAKNKRISVQMATATYSWLLKNGFKNLIPVDNYEEAIKLVLEGKADIAAIGDVNTARWIIMKNGWQDMLKITKDRINPASYTFAVKKGNKNLLMQFNKALKELKRSGIFDKIYMKWFGEEIYHFRKIQKILVYIITGIVIAGFIMFSILVLRLKKEKEKLKEYAEDLKMLNEKLENIRKSLENQTKKFQLLINLYSSISPSSSVEEFSEKLLDISLKLIPECDRGSVVLSKEGKVWEYVAIRGYKEKLKGFRIDSIYLYHLDEEPRIIERIGEYNMVFLPEEIARFYEEIGSLDIVRSIAVGIKVDSMIVGNIFLDTTKDIEISEESIEIMKSIGKLASAFMSIKQYQEREQKYRISAIKAMVNLLEMRDPYTKGHSERVARIASLFARVLGLPQSEIDRIFWAGILHDIGKIGIPESILNKPGKLSDEEYDIVKKHPVLSEHALSGIEFLESLKPIVRSHHERWDGKGYPDGLKGEKIPLTARILAIADSFDAMTSDRPYRKALSIEEAKKEFLKESGKQFDPKLAEIFVNEVIFSVISEEKKLK